MSVPPVGDLATLPQQEPPPKRRRGRPRPLHHLRTRSQEFTPQGWISRSRPTSWPCCRVQCLPKADQPVTTLHRDGQGPRLCGSGRIHPGTWVRQILHNRLARQRIFSRLRNRSNDGNPARAEAPSTLLRAVLGHSLGLMVTGHKLRLFFRHDISGGGPEN